MKPHCLVGPYEKSRRSQIAVKVFWMSIFSHRTSDPTEGSQDLSRPRPVGSLRNYLVARATQLFMQIALGFEVSQSQARPVKTDWWMGWCWQRPWRRYAAQTRFSILWTLIDFPTLNFFPVYLESEFSLLLLALCFFESSQPLLLKLAFCWWWMFPQVLNLHPQMFWSLLIHFYHYCICFMVHSPIHYLQYFLFLSRWINVSQCHPTTAWAILSISPCRSIWIFAARNRNHKHVYWLIYIL